MGAGWAVFEPTALRKCNKGYCGRDARIQRNAEGNGSTSGEMRGSGAAASTGTAAIACGLDGKTGRYEFFGRAEGILSGICGLHPPVKRHGAIATGFVHRRIYEMDKSVKEAHFCTENSAAGMSL